jgi:hypothetical protein
MKLGMKAMTTSIRHPEVLALLGEPRRATAATVPQRADRHHSGRASFEACAKPVEDGRERPGVARAPQDDGSMHFKR